MSVLHVIDEAVLVSQFAKALGHLSDSELSIEARRLAVYPAWEMRRLSLSQSHCFDLAACKAEMIRRALRVGKGFNANKEAA